MSKFSEFLLKIGIEPCRARDPSTSLKLLKAKQAKKKAKHKAKEGKSKNAFAELRMSRRRMQSSGDKSKWTKWIIYGSVIVTCTIVAVAFVGYERLRLERITQRGVEKQMHEDGFGSRFCGKSYFNDYEEVFRDKIIERKIKEKK